MTARAALAQLNSEIVAAQTIVAQLETRADRLRTIVASAAPAEHRLALAIDADDAEALAALAAGNASPIAADLDAADHAKRAALAAEKALPRAIEALEKARDEVSRLEARKPAAVAAVLLEHADAVAREYRAAFRRLGALHDDLVGLARGLAMAGGRDIRMVTDPLAVPKFNTPSLAVGEYDPFLRHATDGRRINATMTMCMRAAQALAADHGADVAPFFTSEAITAAIDPGRPFETVPGPRLVITQRRREKEPTANEAVFEDREYATPRTDRAAG